MKFEKIFTPALLSLMVNTAYCIYNTILGIWLPSWWFLTLAAYYVVLSVMRLAVLKIRAKAQTDKNLAFFAQKFCGFMFLALSVVLAGTAYLSVSESRGIKYDEILMIAIALYAFIKVTVAIINLVKSRKYSSHIVKTLRNISFADALVSIFALQRSMLTTFNGMPFNSITIFNIITGTAVYITVFLLGINLIGGRKTEMAKSKIVNAGQKVADTMTDGYKKIENTVVDGYKTVEKAVVDGYTKIEDKFIDNYLTKDGESIEDAKKRLKNKE